MRRRFLKSGGRNPSSLIDPLFSTVMRLAAALDIVRDLYDAIIYGSVPTLRAIFAEPSLLSRPHAISQLFMASVWEAGFGNGTDEGARPAKIALITSNAHGTVLDLGAGHGHSAQYFDRTKVSRYIALEPNALMHPCIRDAASLAGYHESDGSLVILACGAQDSAPILAALESRQVDTILSILTLCSVPSTERILHNLVRDVLRSGGGFLFYEHVLSHREDVAWWQRFWAPLWQYPFDGCRMDRPTHLYIQNLKIEVDGALDSPWKEGEIWGKYDEPEEHLLWHQMGRFVKK